MVFKHQTFHQEPPVVEQEFPVAATLETAVSDALATAGGIDATAIDVVADGSTIVLSGSVMFESERNRAEEIAFDIDGVAQVRNEIISGETA